MAIALAYAKLANTYDIGKILRIIALLPMLKMKEAGTDTSGKRSYFESNGGLLEKVGKYEEAVEVLTRGSYSSAAPYVERGGPKD
jgi:hypothetical protein